MTGDEHPGQQLAGHIGEYDFAVLAHGFAPHGRDYMVIAQNKVAGKPGTYEVTFTHVVHFIYESCVSGDSWSQSWGDEFTDYETWEKAGQPDGYVWGTNWSLADPGLSSIQNSELATEWSDRVGKKMFEMELETDRFRLRLVFHAVRTRKLSDDTDTVSQVLGPIPPGGGA